MLCNCALTCYSRYWCERHDSHDKGQVKIEGSVVDASLSVHIGSVQVLMIKIKKTFYKVVLFTGV